MKIYLCFIGIILALVQVQCEPPPEMKQFFEECEKEIGITKESMKGNHDDPKVKCFHACVMKKKGVLADGKVAVDKVVENFLKHAPEDKKDEAKAGATECANKANEEKEECDVAGAFHKCLREKLPRPPKN